jgi:hypothetical protein
MWMTRYVCLAAALALAVPASAHLLARGIPLSELAATSPVAVIGRVESAAGGARSAVVVTLAVEQAVIGSVPGAGPLRFTTEGHHPPDYAVGSRVLVFLATRSAPWVSRQTALDLVEVPERAAERGALLAAVRGYAGLRGVTDRSEQIAQLKTFALGNLESASTRVRHEALLDLMGLSSGKVFGPAEVARVRTLASAPSTPATLAPGLVVLLAAIRSPEADTALVELLRGAPNPQVRARAAQVVGHRDRADAAPALRAALRDPALEVRLTAERALARIAATQRRS